MERTGIEPVTSGLQSRVRAWRHPATNHDEPLQPCGVAAHLCPAGPHGSVGVFRDVWAAIGPCSRPTPRRSTAGLQPIRAYPIPTARSKPTNAHGDNANKKPHDVITAPTRRLKYGNMAHGLTREESRRGAEATNRLKAERALEAERAARERLREEVLKSVETYIRLRDDPETPACDASGCG